MQVEHIQTSWMPLARYLQMTSWATAIRTSLWAYPFVQLIHFTGLSLWLGTNVAGDLRLLGVGKKRETAADVRDDLFMWNWIGFCIVVLGGVLLFSARGTAYIINPAFRVKLFMLVPTALIVHIFVQAKTRGWGQGSEVPGGAKAAAVLEIFLWLCVVMAAVEIPNFGG